MPDLGIKLNVDYVGVKNASVETDKLKNKLSDLGSMNVNVSHKMSASDIITQQNKALLQSLNKSFGGTPTGQTRSGATWHDNPDGSRTYVPPGGGPPITARPTGPATAGLPAVTNSNGGKPPDSGDTQQPNSHNEGGTSLLAKTAMLAAGAFTVSSALGFLSRARQTFIASETNREGLTARGISGVDRHLGFNQIEMQDQARSLNARTGLSSKSARRAVSTFSTGSDTDPSLAIGVMERMKNATMDGEGSGKKMLGVLQIIAKLTKDSPERIAKVVGGNIDTVMRAQGGAEISKRRIAQTEAFTHALYNTGVQGRSAETFSILKDAMKPTGDPATDIMKAQMMGMYDGEMTSGKLWDIKKREAAGLTDPENRKGFLGLMKSDQYDQGMKNQFASKFFPKLDPTGVEGMVETIQKFDESEFDAYYKKYSSGGIAPTTGSAVYKTKEREAKKVGNRIGWGEQTRDVYNSAEDFALKNSQAILDSGIMRTVSKGVKTGVDVVDNAVALKGNSYGGKTGEFQDAFMVPLVNKIAGFVDIIGGMFAELAKFKEVIAEINNANHHNRPSADSQGVSPQ
jgi:hypothetical protein